MKTDALYSAHLHAEECADELLDAHYAYAQPDKAGGDRTLKRAHKQLHSLAAALGYRLEPIEVTEQVIR